ncbi:MAG: hypothetical protein AB7W16_29650 [Candidatus Obscuribacterales bacterium]
MKIETTSKPTRIVEDWDFTFINGSTISIVIDREEGDTCEFSPNSPFVRLHRVERPSAINPMEKLPPEEFFISVANVLGIRKQQRTVSPLSIEEQQEWQEVLEELTSKPSTISH